jgi:hypothetical protein
VRRCLIFLVLMVLVGSRSVVAGGQSADITTQPAHDATTGDTPLIPPDLPADPAIWPNQVSCRNSDAWLWQNHETIGKMRPRVLVINFANDVSMDRIRAHVDGIIRATAEATRYHGYEDPTSPAFIEYEVAKYVDLRDQAGPTKGKRTTSSRMPRKENRRFYEVLIDYGALFTDDFAPHYEFRDPRRPDRFLNLAELINAGYVHELWFYAIHDAGDDWPGRETCELKQFYDEQCRPIEGRHGHAGNGRDRTMPWVGRSFRIAFFNPHRGVGCAMENFGHTLEWMATSGSIGYFRRYFLEFADLDLRRRYGTPFNELYRVDYRQKNAITYPTDTSMIVTVRNKPHTLDLYVANGGCVHFPPGARHHYDLGSPHTVKSTIENYRRRNGPDGKDLVRDFNINRIRTAGNFAPDCMGNWMVFWRQCMPGLDNKSLDDDGRPMKNWWPFLFY